MRIIPIFQAATTITCLLSTSVFAELGDRNTMANACLSQQNNLQKLCNIVKQRFRSEQDDYMHLGEAFYLVSVSNTGRIGQGFYVVNTDEEQIKMFGGHGLPVMGSIKKLSKVRLLVSTSQHSMSRGHSWHLDSVIQVRLNPVTKTPYLINQNLSEIIDASGELKGFCIQKANSKHPECEHKDDWGKKLSLNRMELSTPSILKAHKKALYIHKNKIKKSRYWHLDKAGVRKLIDMRPSDMPLHQYVNVLNDYAFFSYEYGGGRNEFAIELLDKVIRLSPKRKVAYLNMAEALEYLSRHSSIPLSAESIAKLENSAKKYKEKYQSMKKTKE